MQEIVAELRWFYNEAGGDMGLKSNFESVARRIGGIYASNLTSSEIDGRLFGAAVRHRRVVEALRAMDPLNVTTLRAFSTTPAPVEPMTGVMLIQRRAREAHRLSRSRRSLADWLNRIAPDPLKPPKKEEHQRLWVQIRADASRELDRALREFDLRWSRRR